MALVQKLLDAKTIGDHANWNDVIGIPISKDNSIEDITCKLNNVIEEMIFKNPNYWIWSHNRWK